MNVLFGRHLLIKFCHRSNELLNFFTHEQTTKIRNQRVFVFFLCVSSFFFFLSSFLKFLKKLICLYESPKNSDKLNVTRFSAIPVIRKWKFFNTFFIFIQRNFC